MTSSRDNDYRARANSRCAKRALLEIFLALAIGLLGVSPDSFAGPLDAVVRFDINAQRLDKALLRFGAQAHLQVSFQPTRNLWQLRTRTLRGDYTGRSALARLLNGTGLYFVQTRNTIAIAAKAQSRTKDQVPIGVKKPLGTPDSPIRQIGTKENTKSPNTADEANAERLHGVTVTGTHIRGMPPESTPVITFTRRQIEDSGYPTLQEFMSSIPQNFGSVGSGATSLGANNLADNTGFGTGVDLRGLGPNTTLVLVNGHRLAQSGENGAFTDVSVIPLDAIARIEVLPSGASAIYGADAVGGVINYVLRTNISAPEATVEYGTVTRGSLKDYRASLSAGPEWSTGSAAVSYEYHAETPLLASDRPFSSESSLTDLFPEARQNSIFATLQQAVDTRVDLTADALYTDRHNHASMSLFETQGTQEADSEQYQGSIGVNWRPTDAWSVRSDISYGSNKTTNADAASLNAGHSTLLLVDTGMDGALASLPSGTLSAAFGAQLRQEGLGQTLGGTLAGPEINRSRTVEATYTEIRVPIIGNRQASVGAMRTLELDLAGRYEHYTEFGSSANPQVGIAWTPLTSARFRGTWSKSFAAPQLWQLYGSQQAYLFNSPDPLSPLGTSAVLILAGAKPMLRAERSTQWTAGLTLTPAAMPGALLDITYYRISFDNRIASPSLPIFDALGSGAFYAPFIQRNPSQAALSSFASAPYIYDNATLIPLPAYGPPRTLAAAVAIADDRLQNIGTTNTDGIDATGTYRGRVGNYEYNVDMDGTYVFSLRETPLPGATSEDFISTIHNPDDFRSRGGLNVSKGLVGGGIVVNYTNRYVDNTVPLQHVDVGSWTTVDFHARYALDPQWPSGSLREVELELSCSNCLNRYPPGVSAESDILGRGYDPTNASPLGRFLSLTLRTTW